jgi:hypothetical protein
LDDPSEDRNDRKKLLAGTTTLEDGSRRLLQSHRVGDGSAGSGHLEKSERTAGADREFKGYGTFACSFHTSYSYLFAHYSYVQWKRRLIEQWALKKMVWQYVVRSFSSSLAADSGQHPGRTNSESCLVSSSCLMFLSFSSCGSSCHAVSAVQTSCYVFGKELSGRV